MLLLAYVMVLSLGFCDFLANLSKFKSLEVDISTIYDTHKFSSMG